MNLCCASSPAEVSRTNAITRRQCIAGLTALSVAAITRGAASQPPPANDGRLLLSSRGGDRATGYVMSNKIARRGEQLVCTWLDVERQNQWALIDARRGKILRNGPVGERRTDNHCGAALATDVDGALHLLIGAHHGTFVHYRMLPNMQDWQAGDDGRAVGRSGTYPSLVCDRDGTLHVIYRLETKGRDPQLHYCRRPKQGPWSAPRVLVRLGVSEHSWLTNAIEVGESGRLHAVFSNTLPVAARGADARYYGASHLYSDDSGQTWRQFGRPDPLVLPADSGSVDRIEGPALASERIEAHYRYGSPLSMASYYHKMVLSNPVIDQRGQPWMILHNLLVGEAQLYRYNEHGSWVGIPLRDAVHTLLPGYRIQHCGQLGRHRDGTIEALLMVSPEDELAWGAPGTTLVRLRFDADGKILCKELACPPESDIPQWLPSLERYCPHAPSVKPALLYTRGANAGGGKQNVNDLKTEVWLQTP